MGTVSSIIGSSMKSMTTCIFSWLSKVSWNVIDCVEIVDMRRFQNFIVFSSMLVQHRPFGFRASRWTMRSPQHQRCLATFGYLSARRWKKRLSSQVLTWKFGILWFLWNGNTESGMASRSCAMFGPSLRNAWVAPVATWQLDTDPLDVTQRFYSENARGGLIRDLSPKPGAISWHVLTCWLCYAFQICRAQLSSFHLWQVWEVSISHTSTWVCKLSAVRCAAVLVPSFYSDSKVYTEMFLRQALRKLDSCLEDRRTVVLMWGQPQRSIKIIKDPIHIEFKTGLLIHPFLDVRNTVNVEERRECEVCFWQQRAGWFHSLGSTWGSWGVFLKLQTTSESRSQDVSWCDSFYSFSHASSMVRWPGSAARDTWPCTWKRNRSMP